MPAPDLMPMEEMLARLDRVLAASPAEETEIAWIEVRRSHEEAGRRRSSGERRERLLFVRVRESGRIGFQRTGEATVSEIENAVRTALAQARLAPAPTANTPVSFPASPAAPEGRRPTDRGPELLDLELAHLEPPRARTLAERLAGREGSARLSWAAGRMAVARSDGRQLSAEATAAAFTVRDGQGADAGSAAAAARSLSGLAPEAIAERARRRRAPAGSLADLPEGPLPLVLSPEATAALVDLLNREALSSLSWREGISVLCDARGQRVFHPTLSLVDDATEPSGLPFPFDFRGNPKARVGLVEEGVLRTPAIDLPLSRQLDAPPTPHAVAFEESLATNLFLLAGASAEGELLEQAGEGALWVGSLEDLACFAPLRLGFRGVARGVRSITGGALGRALPDLVWEADLTAALSGVLAVGRETVVVASGEPFLGGISAPALVLSPSGRLTPASDRATAR
ncbi:MAG TPA: metallopeptidase TldD-related protein [Thermoanaerobaculia bacterium]|nr:metallopeptidase TldD-related protein [Thermoanaerobaculia bacterium]